MNSDSGQPGPCSPTLAGAKITILKWGTSKGAAQLVWGDREAFEPVTTVTLSPDGEFGFFQFRFEKSLGLSANSKGYWTETGYPRLTEPELLQAVDRLRDYWKSVQQTKEQDNGQAD